jgi:adenosylmethionine-8-amino-7-oxononanoate aminotransferase
MTDPLPVYPVESASGVRIRLADGRELVDGMSSWWTAIHGYNHPDLNRAIEEQLEKMAHVMFGGFTHGPAIDLASLLIDISPEPLEKVFFCDSGSVSVEIAIKMALQYWKSRCKEEKSRLLTIRGGYHGDTFGAMSICDPDTGMHSLWKGILPEHLFADALECAFDEPCEETDIAPFKNMIREHHKTVAAVILEPIVQGAGGMRFYSPGYLKKVRELCDEHQVLLVLDEIATGFGRTGRLFACEHAEISPDILCLGKAITGGYMSFAATLATDEVARGISSGDPGLFMHGPTYMANPLACSVAAASTRLLLSSPWRERIADIEGQLHSELATCEELPHVADTRVLGAIGVVEMKEPVNLAAITAKFVERGVWLRPFGRLVYAMPPYIIEPPDLSAITGAIVDIVREGGS